MNNTAPATATWTVRCTSANGLAHYMPATKATADKVAAAESMHCTEADILHNGEFVSAYIKGSFVFGGGE